MADQDTILPYEGPQELTQNVIELHRERMLNALRYVPYTCWFNTPSNAAFVERVTYGFNSAHAGAPTTNDFRNAHNIYMAARGRVNLAKPSDDVLDFDLPAPVEVEDDALDPNIPIIGSMYNGICWIAQQFTGHTNNALTLPDQEAGIKEFEANDVGDMELYVTCFNDLYADLFNSTETDIMRFQNEDMADEFLDAARATVNSVSFAAQENSNRGTPARYNQTKSYVNKPGTLLYVPTFIMRQFVMLVQQLRCIHLKKCSDYSDTTTFEMLLKSAQDHYHLMRVEDVMWLSQNINVDTNAIVSHEAASLGSLLNNSALTTLDRWMCLRAISFWDRWYRQRTNKTNDAEQYAHNYYCVTYKSSAKLQQSEQIAKASMDNVVPLVHTPYGMSDPLLGYLIEHYPAFFATFLRYFCYTDVHVEFKSTITNEMEVTEMRNPSNIIYVNSIALGGDFPIECSDVSWRCYNPLVVQQYYSNDL